MTTADYLKLSDREKDALVAEKVMGGTPCDGWTRIYLGSAGGAAWEKNCSHAANCYPAQQGPRKYTTEIDAAWEVVEKMRTYDSSAFSMMIDDRNIGVNFFASDKRINSAGYTDGPKPTMMVAGVICLAALRAVGAVE